MSSGQDIQAPQPGMIRMIVVNTHRMKNRIEELPLDGHTAIIAKNQSGKTSLMKLLPFFWGAEMRQIQQPSAEKKSFIEFYLPSDSSYVACEYRNARGEVRSVVVHSDPQKNKIQYRLIRGHLTEDLFLTELADGTKSFVKNVDFEANARRIFAAESTERHPRQVHSRLITSTQDFRGIIQGRVPEGASDRVLYRGLIEDYGIGRLSAPLDNVDRLFLTMLDNNFALSDLLSIVANKAMESKTMNVPILGAANSPEHLALAQDFRSYRKVMASEPIFRDAEIADNHRRTYYAELLALAGKLSNAVLKASEAVVALDGDIATAREGARVAEKNITDRVNAANERLSSTNGEIRSGQREIARIEKVGSDLRATGADKAAAELEQRPALRAELETIRKTLDALNGDRDRIEARFSRIIDEAREASRNQAARLDERLIAIPAEVDAVKAQILAASEAILEEVTEKQASVLSSIDNALSELAGKRDTIIDRLSDLKADDELVAMHALQKSRVAEKVADLDKITAKAKTAAREADRAHDEFIQASAAVKQAKGRVELLERREAELRTQREPEAGSLRHWLERNAPDWRQTIGKVIREDILAKKDISPAIDDGTSLFGVKIDLNKLSSSCASLETIEQELLATLADLETARADHAAAQARESVQAGIRQKTMKARDQDQAQADIAANNLKTARLAEADAARNVEVSLAKARETLVAERNQIDASVSRLRAERATMLAQQKAEIEAIRQQSNKRIEEACAPLRKEANDITSQKANLATDLSAKIAGIEADRNAAMRENGTDPDRIHSLIARDTALVSELSRLDQLDARKAAWDDYLTSQLPVAESLRDRLTGLDKDVELLVVEIKALTAEREELSQASHKTIEELIVKRDKMQARLARGEARLKAEQKLVVEAGASDDHADPLLIDDIIEEIELRKVELKKVSGDIASAVRKLKAAFTDVSGRIRESYAMRAKALTNAQEGPEWLPIFADWYDATHLMVRSHIHDLLPTATAPIYNAFKRLEDFDQEIKEVSRRLRTAIAGLAHFPGISEVDLNFRSNIKQIDFWSDLEGFIQIWRDWHREPDAMEPDDLVDALERLLKRFPVGSNPEVNLRDMLYIEGSLKEGLDTRRITRDTDLGKLSSEGGASILRLIILTAAVHLIRDGSNVRFTWCVDEFGRLDRANSRHLLEMLSNNGITLVTGAPDLNHGIRSAFSNRISINVIPQMNTTTLITVDATGKSRIGIRAWNEGEIGYPEVQN